MPNALTITVLDDVSTPQTISTIDNTIGTAGTPIANVQTVQGIAGMTPLSISGTLTANIGTTNGLALDSSVNGILLSQGSTTSGQKGPLLLAAVTTAAPTYTTAQTSPLSLDTAGNLRVSLQATGVTQAVSGTVTANQGGAPWSVVGTLTHNNAAPSTNNVGALIAVASAGAPTYTAGDQVLLSTDLAGNVRVTGSLSVSGTTDNSAYTAGTSTGTPAMGFFHSTIDTVTDGSAATVAIDSKRSQFMVIRDAALNARGANVTAGNALVVDGSAVTQPVSGTVTANQGGSWTVTANAGTNLNTSALALDTSVNGLLLSQGSTTSGEKGPIVQGAVTTNAPTYTTAQTNPLSLDTSGLLRVSLKDTPANTNNLNVNLAASAATVTVSATNLSTNVAQFGGTNVSTGTGASGTGIPRVTVSNDSNVLATQSGTWTVQPGNTPNTTAWVMNITQFGTNNVATGTGASGVGIPRVTVSNDSNVLATQSGTWTVQPGNTANTTPWLTTINQGGNSASVSAANALKVDGSAVTQPVSGTVTANQGGSWTVATTVADGSNIVLGATTDDFVAPGATGSISGKLREISRDVANVDVLLLVLKELRLMNQILASGLNVPDNIDAWRQDPSLIVLN